MRCVLSNPIIIIVKVKSPFSYKISIVALHSAQLRDIIFKISSDTSVTKVTLLHRIILLLLQRKCMWPGRLELRCIKYIYQYHYICLSTTYWLTLTRNKLQHFNKNKHLKNAQSHIRGGKKTIVLFLLLIRKWNTSLRMYYLICLNNITLSKTAINSVVAILYLLL